MVKYDNATDDDDPADDDEAAEIYTLDEQNIWPVTYTSHALSFAMQITNPTSL